MKSLRTDDILGAKPRIRHPPKNLIHQQRTYQQEQFKQYPHDPYQNNNTYHKHIQETFPNLTDVNLSESMHQKSPPHHQNVRQSSRQRYIPQQNGNNNLEGNFGRDRQRDTSHYSYDKLQQIREKEKEILRLEAAEKKAAGISSGTIGGKRALLYEEYQQKYYDVTDKEMNNGMGSIDRRVPRQYIYPRDAPAVNYREDSREMERKYWEQKQKQYYLNSQRDQVAHNRDYSYDQSRQREYGRNYNNMEEQNYANMQRQPISARNNDKPGSSSSNNAKYNLYKQQQQQQQYLQQPQKQPQQQSQPQQPQKQQNSQENNPKQSRGKNLFRGLGYNIITNSKFSYDMENDIKNQTSRWL